MFASLVKALFMGAVFFYITGCSGRPHVQPRSEMIADISEPGMVAASIEYDRARFHNYLRDQEHRLQELVRSRSGSEFRDPTYQLGAGDEIEVNVFDVPELNVTAVVRQSGFVSLPLLGAVPAAGRTEAGLTDAIAERLSEFVHSPQVSVFISNYGSQKVSVIGAVNAPGRYSLKKGGNSILELLSEAGGLRDIAGNYLNFIPGDLSGVQQGARRPEMTDARASLDPDYRQRVQSQALEIPLDRVLGTRGGIPLELPVRNGDMLIIPEAGSVQVDGEVRKVGTYMLGRNMSLLGALAASGGITYAAKVDEIEVIRSIRGSKVHLVVNLEEVASGSDEDVLLKDGDIIRVPSHDGRRLGQDTFDAISRIINFGVGGTVNLAN